MSDLSEVKKKAQAAKEKRARFGPDIELGSYTLESPDYGERPLEEIDVVDRERLLNAGVDVTGRERSGSFIQVDGSVLHAAPTQEGIEVLSTRDALEKYDWLEEYVWKLVEPDTDKFTASAALDFQDGYFVRAMPGARTMFPCRPACT